MIVDTYRNFVEISGLQAKIKAHEAQIVSENKRISDLLQKRQRCQDQIDTLKARVHDLNLKELELKTSSEETKLSKLKEQINMVKNEKELASINHEIDFCSKNLQMLETTFFQAIDTNEKLENEIKDNQNFLQGSEQSLKEIEEEVRENINKEKQEISNYSNRINALLESEETSTQKLFKELNIKFKTSTPFAFLNHKNCSVCRIGIDGQTAHLVENHASLEFCPNCGRLLLPSNLNLY